MAITSPFFNKFKKALVIGWFVKALRMRFSLLDHFLLFHLKLLTQFFFPTKEVRHSKGTPQKHVKGWLGEDLIIISIKKKRRHLTFVACIKSISHTFLHYDIRTSLWYLICVFFLVSQYGQCQIKTFYEDDTSFVWKKRNK